MREVRASCPGIAMTVAKYLFNLEEASKCGLGRQAHDIFRISLFRAVCLEAALSGFSQSAHWAKDSVR